MNEKSLSDVGLRLNRCILHRDGDGMVVAMADLIVREKVIVSIDAMDYLTQAISIIRAGAK